MVFPVIDAHQHVWDPRRAEYSWLGPDMAPIDREMTLPQLLPELRAAGVDYIVQVQSADNPEDTALMRECAAAHSEVVGIVGFAPLDDPAETARTVDSWAGDTLMVGVRNLIHTKADPDWLLRPGVDESLSVLEDRGLALDVVAVLPRHLELVPILSERHPRLRMVIDHLAKPPIGGGRREPWATLMEAASRNPLVFAKVSGLYSAVGDSGSWTPESIRPFVDRAIEMFGTDRLMYGGDWPISVLSGGYTRVWDALSSIFARLDGRSREQILGRTAVEFYHVDAARLGATGGDRDADG